MYFIYILIILFYKAYAIHSTFSVSTSTVYKVIESISIYT